MTGSASSCPQCGTPIRHAVTACPGCGVTLTWPRDAISTMVTAITGSPEIPASLARALGTEPGQAAPVPPARLRTLIMRYLAEHPRATSPQIGEALRVDQRDLAYELHGMADDGLLSLHNVGGLIGWEIIR